MVRIIRSGVSGRLQPGHWTEATRRTEKSCHWRCELEANGTDGGDTMAIVVAASSSILIAGQGRGGGGGGGDVPYLAQACTCQMAMIPCQQDGKGKQQLIEAWTDSCKNK